MAEPWKTDQWFVSPWCYLPEVRKNFNFPANIKIHDVTLRDGEQQTGVVLRPEEKVEIARRLDAMGVHRIEAGMPVVSAGDRRAIEEIANMGLKAEIFSFARCLVDDIKTAKECGVSGVVVEIPSSEHIIRNAYGWDVDRAVKSSIDATLAAKDAGLYTVFFTIDSTRTEVSRLLDLVEHVATEGHMDAFTLADSFGGCHAGSRLSRGQTGDRAPEKARRDSLPSGFRSGSRQYDLRAGRRGVGRAGDHYRTRRASGQRSAGRRGLVAALPVWR